MYYEFYDCCKSKETFTKEVKNEKGRLCTTVTVCQIDNGWILCKCIVQHFEPKEGEEYKYIEPDIIEKKVLYSEDKPSPVMESEDDVIKNIISAFKSKNKY